MNKQRVLLVDDDRSVLGALSTDAYQVAVAAGVAAERLKPLTEVFGWMWPIRDEARLGQNLDQQDFSHGVNC